ncbi:LmeA family phospholipid-binding protein [Actinomadura rudentiformis]|uniref:DUF2993 domain-containing protein n=1 Tax=Actinomadura rudentiformis TaxID=359158 RepID=A0A6H9YM75_9ACTN|nr:DUF2993 domain-containing protein [Actinomadura rudentiformis]KAB2347802.1 DUF2993 domain-containing protein [Actinomadura rudentiformis]
MRKVLLVLLILLIGGVVAADRIGVRVAQDEIGKQVAAQYNLQQQPEVTIHGFPFLTQAIGGEYDQIDVKLGQWTERGVTVGDVTIEMRGVSAPLADVAGGNADNVTAQEARASAVIPYSVIKARAPREVKGIAARGDNLQLDLDGTIAGIPLSGSAVVSVKPSDKGIVITPVSGGLTGLPQLPAVGQLVSWTVPVANLPVGSKISEIQPTPDGLRVGATAKNLRLNDLPNA